jgi:chromosome segregation ATPase
MWMNISGVVGAALEKVQKIQNDIETQMDQAVGVSTTDAPGHPDSSDISRVVEETQSILLPEKSLEAQKDSNGDDAEFVENTIPNHQDTKSEPPLQPSDHVLHEQLNTLNQALELERVKSTNLEETCRKDQQSLAELKLTCLQLEQSLQSEQQSHQQQVSESQKLIESLRKNLDRLGETDAEKENLIKSLEKKHLHEVSKLKQEWNEKNSVLSNNIESLELKNSELSALVSLNKSTSDAENGNSGIGENQKLLDDLKESHTKITEKQKQIDHLHEEIDNWAKKCEEMQNNQLIVSREETERNDCQQRELGNTILQLREKLTAVENETTSWKEESQKTKEIVKERERALETSTLKASELHKQNEELQRKINDLKLEITEKTNQNKQFQSNLADGGEMKREVDSLRDQLREKGSRLEAFELEGSKLAKKQSEMEKLVRKSKQEVKDKETEITKLKESRDQLVKAIEQTQEALRKQEQENASVTKTLNAMNAVSQASSDKLTKLENELNSKNEELITQRKALENSWSDSSELKRSVVELKAERDDLRRQIGEGTSKAIESEGFRREIEQREAVLKATSLQLQENLRNQMSDTLSREERLREEIMELRKKWQDAISSRETLSSELTSATTPLLRQISSLQENLRFKSEQLQTIESQLMERCLRAENFNETFEQKRLFLEEQITTLKNQLSAVTQKYNDCQLHLQNVELNLEKARRNESIYLEERDDYEKKWSQEHLLKQNLSNQIREMELKFKLEWQEKIEKVNHEIASKDSEISKLTKELFNSKEDFNSFKINVNNQKNGLKSLLTQNSSSMNSTSGKNNYFEETEESSESKKNHFNSPSGLPLFLFFSLVYATFFFFQKILL